MRGDNIYREVGFTIDCIQLADHCIASALKLAFPGSDMHTLDTLTHNKRILERATLGRLIHLLSERVELHPDFEQQLRTYCEDRNALIHDWSRICGWEEDSSALSYMKNIQSRAGWLVSIFVEVIRQWTEQVGIPSEVTQDAKDAGVFDAIDGPWLDDLHIMFQRVK